MGNENKKRVECDDINSGSAVVLRPMEKGRSKGTGRRHEEQREVAGGRRVKSRQEG